MNMPEIFVEIDNHLKILAESHEIEPLDGISLLYLINCSFLLGYVKELIAKNEELENEIIFLKEDAKDDRIRESWRIS